MLTTKLLQAQHGPVTGRYHESATLQLFHNGSALPTCPPEIGPYATRSPHTDPSLRRRLHNIERNGSGITGRPLHVMELLPRKQTNSEHNENKSYVIQHTEE